ncbi:hypothetical protein TNCV_1911031 [Trichonephila clavipes]|nr:hypothetical protein TNCV_1911031 [Trichonephila clavipes]
MPLMHIKSANAQNVSLEEGVPAVVLFSLQDPLPIALVALWCVSLPLISSTIPTTQQVATRCLIAFVRRYMLLCPP